MPPRCADTSTTGEFALQALAPPAPEPSPRLLVVAGSDAGRKEPVGHTFTIGRSSECDLQLDDADISRRHCRIHRTEAGDYVLEDLGSRNGTLVDNLRVRSHRLRYGQRIQLGRGTVLLFTHHDPLREVLLQRQKMEALGRLGTGIAHDLNNLLSVMTASLRYLASIDRGRPLGDAEVVECHGDLDAAVESARELTARLVQLARPSTRQRSEVVDASALVLEVVRLVRRLLPHSIRMEPDIRPGLFVRADPEELHQVLMNLALNARDAMPDGGTLSLQATAVPAAEVPDVFPGLQGELVSLVVADTGIGMDEATRERIFEPFFTTKPAGQRTGLGLSTAYEVVHGHGGHIDVESAPGRGARFRVLLPATTEDAAGPRRGTAGPADITADRADVPVRAMVLVVDDQELVRRSTARLLRQRGHVALQAASGEEALEALDAGASPDVVLLDLDMPGMGGEACLEALRRLRPDLRVVLLSGLLDDERAQVLEARGAAACLRKPFEPEILERTIRRVLAETAGKS